MNDHTRSSFILRTGERLGTALVMRFPAAHPEAARICRRLGLDPPNSTKLGYFRALDEPAGAIAYMPRNDTLALALMDIPSVRDRIIEDLVILAREAADA